MGGGRINLKIGEKMNYGDRSALFDKLHGKWYKWWIVISFSILVVLFLFLIFVTVPSFILNTFTGNNITTANIENTQVIVLLFYAYISPSITAWVIGQPNVLSITVLNVLLGWTIIGWIFSLIWALKSYKFLDQE